EGHRRLILVVLRVREADTESVCHGSVLLSTDLVHGMLRCDQRVTGHAAPGRNVGAGARIAGGQAQHLAGLQRLQALPELEHEVAAAEVARVPPGVGDARSRRAAHDSLRSPFRSSICSIVRASGRAAAASPAIRPARRATRRSAYARARWT